MFNKLPNYLKISCQPQLISFYTDGCRNKLFKFSRNFSAGTTNSAIYIYYTVAVTFIEVIVNKVYCL